MSAVLVFAGMFPAWWLASGWYETRLLSEQRSLVMTELSPHVRNVTSAVRGHLAVLEGLRAFVAAEASSAAFGEHFERYGEEVLAGTREIRNVAIWPGGILRFTYPLAENRLPIGHDALHDEHPGVREDVELAIKSRLIALSDPFDQSEGRLEWTAWLAVYRDSEFWGLVSTRLDLSSILSDITSGGRPIALDLALRDDFERVLYGKSSVFERDPVSYRIDLPEGHWELAMTPAAGWYASIREPLLIFRFSGLTIMALSALLVYLVVNRQTLLGRAVAERTREISRINEALTLDIVRRERAETALRETQRVLSTLLSNLPGMAYQCRNDRARSMEFVSEGCFELTGYQPSELVANGKTSFVQLIHPDDRERVWNEIQCAIHHVRPFRLIYRISTADGSEKWVLEQGRGVIDSEGRLIALEGFITDTTDRVMAYQVLEQRVSERTRQLAALYDVTAVASASLDLRTIVEHSLDRIVSVMGSEIGLVQLVRPKDKVLHPAASRGIAAEVLARLDRVPSEPGLSAWVVEHDEPVAAPDLSADPRGGEGLRSLGSVAYVGVPVRAKGQVLGVLSVVREVDRPFDAEEVGLLAAIGDQLGVAVENARLFTAAQGKAALEERQRLARDLHDSVTQLLWSQSLMAESGRRAAVAGQTERAQEYLIRLANTAQQALKEMRLLVYELRPAALEREGLVGALQRRLDAVERRGGVDAQLVVEGVADLPASFEEGLYRIAQEALNNALKHAAATSVTVRVQVLGRKVEMTVVDTGRGFDPSRLANGGGLGLGSIRERAERLGGSAEIVSTPGAGTIVRVTSRIPGLGDARPASLSPSGSSLEALEARL